jgi:D-glycero-D-manno-heptose 1,7-bisphosphate phosphatase
VKRGLFLDRDGTLIPDYDYLDEPSRVEIIPGVSDALRRARTLGYSPFLFSNQSGVGRGYFTLDTVHACNRRMLELLDLSEDFFIDVCLATEHPDETPVYRKPSPRFIIEMAEQHDLDVARSYMVGDKLSDLETATNAGARGAFVKTGKPFSEDVQAYAEKHGAGVFDDLVGFVDYLEKT